MNHVEHEQVELRRLQERCKAQENALARFSDQTTEFMKLHRLLAEAKDELQNDRTDMPST